MTTPEHQAYLGRRLDLTSLRGEVTQAAAELRVASDEGASAREVGCSWIVATLEEAAELVRATLDTTIDERAQLVVDLQAAADALHTMEIGDD